MKAIEIVNEVFNSNVPGKVTRKTATTFQTRATIGERDIIFDGEGRDGEWEVAFTENHPKTGSTFGKTGSGNELQVFSFVLESLQLLISIYSPVSVEFTSEKSDGNRSQLYSRIARKVKVPGYHLDVEDRVHRDLFRIVRDDK